MAVQLQKRIFTAGGEIYHWAVRMPVVNLNPVASGQAISVEDAEEQIAEVVERIRLQECLDAAKAAADWVEIEEQVFDA